jgi:hypothetical protein
VLTLGTEVTGDAVGIVGACVMCPCAVTHDPNFDQRRVPLALVHVGDSLRVTLPAAAGVAPPGDYMLFLLRDASGVAVPSIARWIRIRLQAPVLGVPPRAEGLFSFAPPWPNPAHGPVRMRFTLPREGRVRISVQDAAGRLVRTLEPVGGIGREREVVWDRRDQRGHLVAAGRYFLRIRAAAGERSWPVVLMR